VLGKRPAEAIPHVVLLTVWTCIVAFASMMAFAGDPVLPFWALVMGAAFIAIHVIVLKLMLVDDSESDL
jgi:hypothetical protein